MSFIKIIIIAFILFILWRTFIRFRRRDITGREFGIWAIFWLIVAITALIPQQTDVIAQFLGVERGADLLVYISIIVLFFIVFRTIVKLEKINKDVTAVVRRDALAGEKQENIKTLKH